MVFPYEPSILFQLCTVADCNGSLRLGISSPKCVHAPFIYTKPCRAFSFFFNLLFLKQIVKFCFFFIVRSYLTEFVVCPNIVAICSCRNVKMAPWPGWPWGCGRVWSRLVVFLVGFSGLSVVLVVLQVLCCSTLTHDDRLEAVNPETSAWSLCIDV